MATSTRQLKDIATALVEVAMREHALPEVLISMHAVSDALNSDRALALSLSDSVIPLETRQKALQDALKGQVHSLVTNTLLVLQQEGLLGDVVAFTSAVASSATEQASHRRAVVTSAIELKADERHELEKTLVEKFGGTIELVMQTDPKLIGGFVVNVDGWLFDGSVLGTCNRLASVLAEA